MKQPHPRPNLEQLRSLQGTWDFASLEVSGLKLPPGAYATSQLLIDGDRFCMRSPGADYDGVFIIDVDADPPTIDIHFVAGPEAGNTSYGIFDLNGDELRFCLGFTGVPRPREFVTAKGSGHALERLVRASAARPADMTAAPYRPTIGGAAADASGPPATEGEFAFVPAPIFDQLEGTWTAVEAARDGFVMPREMLAGGRRVGVRNEVKVSWGGQVMTDALLRIDSASVPMSIDYLLRSGPARGQVQRGIMEWADGGVRFCSAAPGDARPTEFACPAGSGRTMSRWRKA